MLLDRFTAANGHSLLQRWLLGCLLMLNTGPALGESYLAWDESLQELFTWLSVPLGQPIVVSKRAAGKRISGQFDLGNAQAVLETVASQHGLIWYSDGQVLHLYDASEAKSSGVTLRHITVDKLREAMRRSGLDEARYPLRKAGLRLFYVSGPANYVDQVMRLAQLMDRQRPARRQDLQRVGLVQVLNADVADQQYGMAGQKTSVPGMATLVERRLAELGRKAGAGASVIAYPQVNSLLIKGSEHQLRLIKNLVAELDVPMGPLEVSLHEHEFEKTAVAPPADLNATPNQIISTPLSADQYERVRRAFARMAEQ